MMKKRLFLLLMASLLLPFGMRAQDRASNHIDVTVNACDTFFWAVTGETFNQSGIHTHLQGDTLYILDLSIYNSYNLTVPEVVHGGCVYMWGTMACDTTGPFTQTFTSVNGCDSTVHINVSISGQAVKGYTVTSCESYTWKDTTFTQSCTFLYEDTTNEHCDSLLTLYLTILEPEQKIGDTVVSACEKVTAFKFIPTQSSGSITVTHDTVICSENTVWGTSAAGREFLHPRTVAKCYDTIIYVHFVIKNKVIETFNFEGCDKYVFQAGDSTINYYYSQTDSINWGKANNGCDSIYKVYVNIYDSPDVFISGDLRVRDGETATLHANSDQDVLFTWSYNNSHDETITTEPLTQNTDISLTAANLGNGCQSVANVTILVTTVGIGGVENGMLSIYPNPTSDMVNINADRNVNQVTVFNLNGQQVMNVKGSKSVDMRSLSNGNYILRIELEDGSVATGTVVLKK